LSTFEEKEKLEVLVGIVLMDRMRMRLFEGLVEVGRVVGLGVVWWGVSYSFVLGVGQ